VTILIKNNRVDFNKTTEGVRYVEQFTQKLWEERDKLALTDIRSVANPLGIASAADDETPKKRLTIRERAEQKVKNERAKQYYVSDVESLDGHVTRIDLILQEDPFSRRSISQLDQVQRAIYRNTPPEIDAGSESYVIGATASIRDLKHVTDRDQIRIDILVLGGVFLILVALLRRPAISAYLIVSVFFSYLVTLGVTFSVFFLLDPSGFAGLDWKVPMFLFTILIAVGEDYNIFLMTRIEEEQRAYGPIKGVTVALTKTGRIISSCGFIMAGTFASLTAGSLMGMVQLGFALAFGVLLDTFVVRPILVPAYLILLYSGRFGIVGRFLGAGERSSAEIPAKVEAG
jgi:RND superfamily putative drug exporter